MLQFVRVFIFQSATGTLCNDEATTSGKGSDFFLSSVAGLGGFPDRDDAQPQVVLSAAVAESPLGERREEAGGVGLVSSVLQASSPP
jgi:hypothetical protein